MEKVIQDKVKHGFKLLNSGEFKASLLMGKNLLVLDGSNIEAVILTGLSYFKLNNYEASLGYLELAKSRKQFDKPIRLFYLENLIRLEKNEQALEELEKIVNIVNENQFILLKSSILETMGRYQEVINNTKLLTDSVKSIKKDELLAWNYELTNQLKKARDSARNGLLKDQTNFKCNSVLVKYYLRHSKFKKSNKYLKQINKKQLSKVNLSIYYSLKGQLLEKSKKYNKAFKAYTKSNKAIKSSEKFAQLNGNNFYTLEKIKKIKRYFRCKPKFKTLLPSKQEIVFMVGFPRSGTTLLENILNSHSKISTIEEKPTTDRILRHFLEENDSLQRLETLDEAGLIRLQQIYIQDRNKYIDCSVKVIIDKLPLNLVQIGILYRVFPNAKFIISLRDIRDVALSCYFQSFQINDAMANFLDWKSTCNYLMELIFTAISIIEKYPINIHIIEYEELVSHPFQNVKKIIKFLNLDWQNTMFNYRENIKGENINTPSYSSVIKKISTKRTQRWKNYKSQVEILDIKLIQSRIKEIISKHKVHSRLIR